MNGASAVTNQWQCATDGTKRWNSVPSGVAIQGVLISRAHDHATADIAQWYCCSHRISIVMVHLVVRNRYRWLWAAEAAAGGARKTTDSKPIWLPCNHSTELKEKKKEKKVLKGMFSFIEMEFMKAEINMLTREVTETVIFKFRIMFCFLAA